MGQNQHPDSADVDTEVDSEPALLHYPPLHIVAGWSARHLARATAIVEVISFIRTSR